MAICAGSMPSPRLVDGAQGSVDQRLWHDVQDMHVATLEERVALCWCQFHRRLIRAAIRRAQLTRAATTSCVL